MRKIGVVTAGGDAPGINACLRAVVRTAIHDGLEVIGIEDGFAGLIGGKTREMGLRSVSGIINRGGTILRTRRCNEMRTPEGLSKAAKVIKRKKIEGLIIIGGDGSFRGGWALHRVAKIPIVGIPASIDNDIAGTETTIGFDTAVNTALRAISKIRDTAFSLERIFIVEVMGRESGFLALHIGLVCGAEIILIPELDYSLDAIVKKLREFRRAGKRSVIIVMAEGAGNPAAIANHIKHVTGYDVRVSTLGYIQRGGMPTARSTWLASVFGHRAAKLLPRIKSAKMLGIEGGRVVVHPLDHPIKHKKRIDFRLYDMAGILSI